MSRDDKESEEERMVTNYEVDAFLNSVDVVRADVDRLAARIQRLKDTFPA